MDFKPIASIMNREHVGREACIRGWIYRRSVVGGKAFVRVRDSTGVIQVVVDSSRLGDELVDSLKNIGLEASVMACGEVREEPKAPGGFELHASFFRIVGDSRDFPIKGGEGEEYLMNNRHLWIRSPRYASLFKIKHTVINAGREYFSKNGLVGGYTPPYSQPPRAKVEQHYSPSNTSTKPLS